jgi:hypothetical protein
VSLSVFGSGLSRRRSPKVAPIARKMSVGKRLVCILLLFSAQTLRAWRLSGEIFFANMLTAEPPSTQSLR